MTRDCSSGQLVVDRQDHGVVREPLRYGRSALPVSSPA